MRMKLMQPRLPAYPELGRKLIYCDIGARWGLGHPWSALRESLKCVSFEPDTVEHALLLTTLAPGDACHPLALYSRAAELDLHLTRSRGCTSIYAPNMEFLKNFPDSARFEVEKTVRIHAVTLDDLYSAGTVPDLDFIKVDVQGAELDILQGGRRLISERVMGIEVEVEFAPMYTGQPLFRDVDRHLAAEGFQLQDLRRNYWKLKGAEKRGALKGQVIFGDALYFRPIADVIRICMALTLEEGRGKLESCLIMATAYGYLDYATVLLQAPESKVLLGKAKHEVWTKTLHKFGQSFRFWHAGRGRLASIFYALYRLFQGSHGGWATSDAPLGSSKKLGWFH